MTAKDANDFRASAAIDEEMADKIETTVAKLRADAARKKALAAEIDAALAGRPAR
jgi:hypothetical protein